MLLLLKKGIFEKIIPDLETRDFVGFFITLKREKKHFLA